MATTHPYRVIQESLIGLISNVAGVGRVLPEQPLTLTDAEFKDMFGIQKDAHDNKYDINIWFLEWKSAKPSRSSAETSTYYVNYNFTLTGFYGHSETSEEEIRNTSELIMDTLAVHLRAGVDPTGPDVLNVEDLTVEIQDFGPTEFGPVFCSSVVMNLTAFTRRAPATYVV